MDQDDNDWSMIPSHVVLGGSWADVSRISQEEWDRLPGGPNAEPGVVGGVTWLLEDTAPKGEKKNETLAESTCTSKGIHSEKTGPAITHITSEQSCSTFRNDTTQPPSFVKH